MSLRDRLQRLEQRAHSRDLAIGVRYDGGPVRDTSTGAEVTAEEWRVRHPAGDGVLIRVVYVEDNSGNPPL